jgi:hypothetical protein
MGAWGTGIFENDDAADFVAEYVEGADLDEAVSLGAGGSGLFMVMGTGLGIRARWRSENGLEISVPKGLDLGEIEKRVQYYDALVHVTYVWT